MTAAEFGAAGDAVLTMLIVVVVLGLACALAYAVRVGRRPRPAADPLAVERNTHDWNCDVGAWPHEGNCWPAPERGFVAVMQLAQCEQRGLGNSIRVAEDDYCGGAGE